MGMFMDASDRMHEAIERIEREIEPLVDTSKSRGGYDCCGCTTLGALYDDIMAVLKGEEPKLERLACCGKIVRTDNYHEPPEDCTDT